MQYYWEEISWENKRYQLLFPAIYIAISINLIIYSAFHIRISNFQDGAHRNLKFVEVFSINIKKMEQKKKFPLVLTC